MNILIAILLLGLAFVLIAIRILLKKDGEFAGTCASNNPMFQNDEGTCGFCGAKPDEQCKEESK
jgi:hypothetical protein